MFTHGHTCTYIYIYIHTRASYTHVHILCMGKTSSDVLKVWDLQQQDPDDRATVRVNSFGVWGHNMLAQDLPPEPQRIQATQLDLKCSTHRPELWVPKVKFQLVFGVTDNTNKIPLRELPVNPKPKLKNAQP